MELQIAATDPCPLLQYATLWHFAGNSALGVAGKHLSPITPLFHSDPL